MLDAMGKLSSKLYIYIRMLDVIGKLSSKFSKNKNNTDISIHQIY